MEGIDVSRYQGSVNWNSVSAAGKEFAIIRAGYGRLQSQRDPTFIRNYNGAVAAGLRVGCYWYSYADTVDAALQEAETCLAVIGDRAMPMGVWFDQEYETEILALNDAQRTDIVLAFMNRIRQAGYISGLYCSADWLRNQLEYSRLQGRNLWIARYGSTPPSLPLPFNIWQYTDSGRVNGIQGNVDLDRLDRELTDDSGGGGSDRGPFPPLGDATLRRGDRGTFVFHLQAILIVLGYNPGPLDGIFGAQTEAAVIEFQQDEGLVDDGLVGNRTKQALEDAWNS
ncbi:MAG: peptidoglycan-binding protein [Faecalibacterium sp.]|nr:peptidoglycan-binding protein [Faecalibacterium sp.]